MIDNLATVTIRYLERPNDIVGTIIRITLIMLAILVLFVFVILDDSVKVLKRIIKTPYWCWVFAPILVNLAVQAVATVMVLQGDYKWLIVIGLTIIALVSLGLCIAEEDVWGDFKRDILKWEDEEELVWEEEDDEARQV